MIPFPALSEEELASALALELVDVWTCAGIALDMLERADDRGLLSLVISLANKVESFRDLAHAETEAALAMLRKLRIAEARTLPLAVPASRERLDLRGIWE